MSVCVASQTDFPHLLTIQLPIMKTVDSISDFGSCLQVGAGSAFPEPIITTQAMTAVESPCFDLMPMDLDTKEPPASNVSFWVLPPELRTMVYKELLLSDSAFRLGHHGPYSHEKRRQLYPQILRTCKSIFMEASEVLYGDNTFYLGKSPTLP